MNLLSLNGISKSIGNKTLFENVSFGIESGQKVALIGTNGCGKTTLLRIIAGVEKNDNGDISKNRETVIDYLEQLTLYDPEETVLEFISGSENPLTTLIKKYEESCILIAGECGENDRNEFHRLSDEMEKHNAWEYELRIKSLLSEFDITDLTVKMKNLSGGMIKKAAIAHCLIGNANLVLMDEPTNHLDLATIRFLEEYLKKTDKALVLVTHDRYFLDSVCTVMLEFDRKSIIRYEGNYSYYLEKKSEMQNNLLKEDDRIDNLLRKELEWYKRQPKARTTKSKSRMDAIDELVKHEKFKDASEVEMTIKGRRLGKKILELTDITKSFGNKTVMKKFSHVFKQREKIGIIGPNGSGKTTFLNLITGVVKPDSGLVDTGINTEFGYFSQIHENIDDGITVIDYIKNTADLIKTDKGVITAEKMLENFLFPVTVHRTGVAYLSGGEKRRLQLLQVLMRNPNFLILDEPTNDLDIKTLSILENFLMDFGGCLLVVTHDRYFINRIIDHLFVFDSNGNIESFPGNYNDFLEHEDSQIVSDEVKKPVENKIIGKPSSKEKTRLSFKEKKELEVTEKKIGDLEEEKKELEEKLGSGKVAHEDINEMTRKYDSVEKELAVLLERWEYLAEFEQ